MDYSLNRHNWNPNTAQDNQIASLHFNTDDLSNSYEVPLRRVSGGYALQAPMYDQDGTTANFEVSKTSEFHWFIGPKLNVAF